MKTENFVRNLSFWYYLLVGLLASILFDVINLNFLFFRGEGLIFLAEYFIYLLFGFIALIVIIQKSKILDIDKQTLTERNNLLGTPMTSLLVFFSYLISTTAGFFIGFFILIILILIVFAISAYHVKNEINIANVLLKGEKIIEGIENTQVKITYAPFGEHIGFRSIVVTNKRLIISHRKWFFESFEKPITLYYDIHDLIKHKQDHRFDHFIRDYDLNIDLTIDLDDATKIIISGEHNLKLYQVLKKHSNRE